MITVMAIIDGILPVIVYWPAAEQDNDDSHEKTTEAAGDAHPS